MKWAKPAQPAALTRNHSRFENSYRIVVCELPRNLANLAIATGALIRG